MFYNSDICIEGCYCLVSRTTFYSLHSVVCHAIHASCTVKGAVILTGVTFAD